MLSCSNDKTIKIWNFSTLKFIYSFSGHSNWVRCARFSPDVRLIASASDDKTVRLWDIASQSLIHPFTDHSDKVYSTRFHPDGTLVASAGLDGKIKLWDLRSKSLIQHYDASDDAVNEIVFHPSGRYLGSVSDDKSVKIWDLREGRLGYTLYSHEGGVNAMTFSNDGDFFATAGEDKLIFVWKSNFCQKEPGEERVTSAVINKGTKVDDEPMGRMTQNIVEEVEESKEVSEREVRESKLKEFLSTYLEKVVYQLGEVTENIQRIDQKLSKNEEMVQGFLKDERISVLVEKQEEEKAHWEAMRREVEKKTKDVQKNLQNIFSVGALANTGMLKDS